MKFDDGIYDISNETYHGSKGLSRSALWEFKELPKKYWYKYLSGQHEEPKESAAYAIGSLVHALLLEPETVANNFYEMPECDRRTKIGKEVYNSALEFLGTKTAITPAQMKMAMDMANAVLNNTMVKNTLRPVDNIQVEKSIYWTDPLTKIQCKCRPDAIKSNIVLEIKTCEDASPRYFQQSAMKYGYFLQAAQIYEGMKARGLAYEYFLFVCVEKSPPYATALYMLDDAALQYGLDLFHKLLKEFKKCSDEDVWPDYGVQTLGVPTWAVKEIEND